MNDEDYQAIYNSNPYIQYATDSVVFNLNKDKENKGFDIILILMIVSIIVNIIRIIQACEKKGDGLVKMSKNPTWLQTKILNRQIKRAIGKNSGVTLTADELQASILAAGCQLTDEQADAILNSVEP